MVAVRALSPLTTVVIPAFNEGPGLAERLDAILGVLNESNETRNYEIVVVDDGSADETYQVATQAAAKHPNLRVIRHEMNRGLGAALRTGFAAASGSVVVTYDSDMSYRPEIIEEMVVELECRSGDLVLASAYMPGGSVVGVPWMRRMFSREANRFLSFATNGRYATITCMVRAYRADFLRNIVTTEDRMEINPELFFKAVKNGAVVSEIPAQLRWSSERARSHAKLNLIRTCKQIGRTFRYGVAYRPAVLLALPGILPGVLPLIVAICVLLHLNIKTIALITLVTMIIQNTSLALFAGQLGVFAHNVVKRRGGRARA
jgi:glycosyltransferase involved in cell wall biosynthesis